MKQFADSTGAVWALKIDIGAARRVLSALGVNILNPAEPCGETTVSQRLMYDDLFLVDVVRAIVDPKDVDFDARIDGETIGRIEKAFWEEYRVFFAARGKEWAVRALDLDLEAKEARAREALNEIETFGATSQGSPDDADSSASTT